ncbi:MAG: flagellar hook protein FlgE [Candidatus Liberibacter ctenarytainae]|uniref:Flagellar hook protein FlgE n=1 Tax=Candidatus Liberibacter ctenarytainae TaxID=2020335 RepID=A0A937AB59_9HYPH|nr:flagellar hook protein FlgE [Candidatus Liberibacter ctenarytainae]
MGIFGTMKTAISGMNAQSDRVSVVSDNIANVNTTGYKRSAVAFSTLVCPRAAGSYTSGGIEVYEKNTISEQGSLVRTASNTDLAIQGAGFFLVKDHNEKSYLTRSGDFHVNNHGYLENIAGHVLLGRPIGESSAPLVINSFKGLEKIKISNLESRTMPTTSGLIAANLEKDAKIISKNNAPGNSSSESHIEYTNKTSFAAYDSLGSQVIYDLYYTKIGNAKWEVSVFRQDQSTNYGFPYANQMSKTATPPLAKLDISFNIANGSLEDSSQKEISFIDSTSGVDQKIKIDLSKTTQIAGGFTPQKAVMNGQAPAKVKDFSVSKDGNIDIIYADGSRIPAYRLVLATVPSEDRLKACDGNTYLPTRDSGDINIGFPGDGRSGEIFSGALESANVDIANELTELIESQRNYAANSKVFQTSSDFMDILISLKR